MQRQTDFKEPQHSAKFESFKEELLNWKEAHLQEYKNFARHMNSSNPEAMVGLAQLLAFLCPEISYAMAECWNDDTLCAHDWIQRLSRSVSLPELLGSCKDAIRGKASDCGDECQSMEEARREVADIVRQNGSIAEYAQGIMKSLIGDTPIPKEIDDFLSGVFGALQANVDRLSQADSIDSNAISEVWGNVNGMVNECFQDSPIGTAIPDMRKWVSDIKLQNPDHFVPLLLTWLIHGQAFEKIVTVLNDQAAQVTWPMNKTILDAAVEAVDLSVENGYRSHQQWDDFFELNPIISGYIARRWKKACPASDEAKGTSEEAAGLKPGSSNGTKVLLSQYLTCANKGAVLKILEEFLRAHTEAKDTALAAIALRSLNLIPDLTDDRETSRAIYNEFAGIITGLKAENSIRKALGTMKGTILKKEKDGSKKEVFVHETEPIVYRKQILIEEIRKSL